MPPIETLINTSLSHINTQLISLLCPAKRTAAHKNFSARRQNKNRDKTAKGQDTAKETRKGQRDEKPKRESKGESKKRAKREQKERAKPKRESKRERARSPKRVASKDQQGEVPGPSFEGVCLSAGKVPNKD